MAKNQYDYDAIVVGARCAGSPTAMLLARKGYKVLVVDKATFPSDTISTHLIHPPGVAALKRWGLLDGLWQRGVRRSTPMRSTSAPSRLPGHRRSPRPALRTPHGGQCSTRCSWTPHPMPARKCGRRLPLRNWLIEDGHVIGIRGHGKNGRTVTEHARVVSRRGWPALAGRGGRARRGVPREAELLAAYYTYYSGLPMDGRFETYVRPERGFAAWPTNDGLTLVIAGWPFAEFDANRKDIEGNFLKTLDLAPTFADRVRAARREERFLGVAVPNYFRKPYGPGWALVGDAGYNKDFITAQGIQDAFRDAELCAAALDKAFSGQRLR